MTKTIETLVEDIYHILDAQNDHEVDEENVEYAGELFKEILRTRFRGREIESKNLRMSALGKPSCQQWFGKHEPEAAEKMPPKAYMKFLFGDVLEILLLFLTKESGHEVTHEQFEVDVDDVKGHMDCCIDGVPVDVKSASPFSFQKFASETVVFDDPFGYVAQLSGYAHAIDKTDRAAFLVVDKVDGSICLSWLDEVTIKGNPPARRIEELRDVLAQPSPTRCFEPEPEGKSGNLKLGRTCGFCDYKRRCWDDSNEGQGLRTFFYSRGPVFLTTVKRVPDVPEAA